jgi:hypothetical protein
MGCFLLDSSKKSRAQNNEQLDNTPRVDRAAGEGGTQNTPRTKQSGKFHTNVCVGSNIECAGGGPRQRGVFGGRSRWTVFWGRAVGLLLTEGEWNMQMASLASAGRRACMVQACERARARVQGKGVSMF